MRSHGVLELWASPPADGLGVAVCEQSQRAPEHRSSMNCSELDGATIPEQYSSRISGTFSWKKRLMNRLSCCFHAYVAIGHVGVKCLTGFRKSWGRLLKTRKEKKRGRGEKLFIDPIIRLSAVSPSQRYWSYLLAIREDPCEYIFAAGIRKIPYMHLFSKAQGTLP